MVCGSGVRKPMFLLQYLPKIEVSSAAYPSFSFRQFPSASVGFRGLPPPYIVGIWTTWYVGGGGRVPEFLIQYVPKIEVRSAVFPILAPVGFRLFPWNTISSYIFGI